MIRAWWTVALLLISLPASAWHEWASLSSVASARFLSIRADTSGELRIDASQDQSLARFTLLDADFGVLKGGDTVFLRAADGRFVSVGANGVDIRADAPAPLSRQRFVLIANMSAPCALTPSVRHELCERWEFQLRHQDTGGCLGANADDAGATARLFDCSNSRATAFKVTIHPEQPPLLSLSAPFAQPPGILPLLVFGVDHRHIDGSEPANKRDCTNAEGHQVQCYGGHEGTDFMYGGSWPGQRLGSMDVLAAAPGFVVSTTDGNSDRCYYQPGASDDIRCPGSPAGTFPANTVVIVQDDGVIARYYHLKTGSVAVKAGDYVPCGQVLGKIGSSGHSTGPHLHFDMARPFFVPANSCRDGSPGPVLPTLAPGGDNAFGDFAAGNTPNCPSGARLDPYDPAIAQPRQTLWRALGPSHIPKLACAPSTTHGKPVPPGSPGAPCNLRLQCLPGLACGSAGSCVVPAGSGNQCTADRECAFGLNCDQGICTRRNGILGQGCDAARHCSLGFQCSNGFCAFPSNTGEGGCPSGEQPRCPLVYGCYNNRNNQCKRAGGVEDCPRVCAP